MSTPLMNFERWIPEQSSGRVYVVVRGFDTNDEITEVCTMLADRAWLRGARTAGNSLAGADVVAGGRGEETKDFRSVGDPRALSDQCKEEPLGWFHTTKGKATYRPSRKMVIRPFS